MTVGCVLYISLQCSCLAGGANPEMEANNVVNFLTKAKLCDRQILAGRKLLMDSTNLAEIRQIKFPRTKFNFLPSTKLNSKTIIIWFKMSFYLVIKQFLKKIIKKQFIDTKFKNMSKKT